MDGSQPVDQGVRPTIWKPILLGVGFGLIAGISIVTRLSFLTDSADTQTAIGLYNTLGLLGAALGGPIAGAIIPAFWVGISAVAGPADMKALISVPKVFWSNVLSQAFALSLVGILYRKIFERWRLPGRLLAWAGMVITWYLIGVPLSITPQYYLIGDFELLPAIRASYQTFLPQMIFDIFFTSLVFVALPKAYRRPMWIGHEKSPEMA